MSVVAIEFTLLDDTDSFVTITVNYLVDTCTQNISQYRTQ